MNEPVDLERHDIFSAIVGAALAFASDCGARLVQNASAYLRARSASLADDRARRRMDEAAELLVLRQPLFEDAFPRAVREQVHSGQHAPERVPLRFETLELMGEDELEEDLEVLRGAQTLLEHVESELSLVNALVSAARGRNVVSSADNPFLPEAWVRALRSAARQSHVRADVRVRWLASLADALRPELAVFYSQLCAMLRGWGIRPASFVVTNVHGAAAAYADEPRVDRDAAPAALNLRDLRRLIAAEAGERAEQASYQEDPVMHAPTLSWALEAVRELEGVDQVVERVRRRLARGPATAAGADTPVRVNPDQELLADEVVRVLVAKITEDKRLLAPVRLVAGELLAPLQKLARRDARFFRDKNHPARLLLSEFTERSMAWRSPRDAGFAEFLEPVREAVSVLSELEVADAEPFAFALTTLREVWAQAEERARKQRAKAERAAMRSEQRKQLAKQIAAELQAREDVETAPALIRSFVLGPWSQVLACAASGGTSDQEEYAALVNDLIWSAQPRLTAIMRSNLARMIPQMVTVLRRGLALIEHPAQETDRFLAQLLSLHEMGLQDVNGDAFSGVTSVRDEPVETAAHADVAAARANRPSSPASASATAWAPTLQLHDAAEAPSAVGQSAHPRRGPADIQGLRPGMWIDISGSGRWSRMRLTWVTGHSLLFTFVDAKGQPLSMTRSKLEGMMQAGSVRIVATEPPIDTALDALVQHATRNTLRDSTLPGRV